MTSPTLAALARLQAGTTDTPIHDALVVQHAVRQLSASLQPAMEGFRRAMEQVGRNVATFAARVQQAQAAEAASRTPEATLARIRSDQASLAWHDAWAAEREACGPTPTGGWTCGPGACSRPAECPLEGWS